MFISSVDVAKRFGLSMSSIRVYTKKYGIGKKVGGRWFFNKRDIRILEERNQKRGNPNIRTIGGR